MRSCQPASLGTGLQSPVLYIHAREVLGVAVVRGTVRGGVAQVETAAVGRMAQPGSVIAATRHINTHRNNTGQAGEIVCRIILLTARQKKAWIFDVMMTAREFGQGCFSISSFLAFSLITLNTIVNIISNINRAWIV